MRFLVAAAVLVLGGLFTFREVVMSGVSRDDAQLRASAKESCPVHGDRPHVSTRVADISNLRARVASAHLEPSTDDVIGEETGEEPSEVNLAELEARVAELRLRVAQDRTIDVNIDDGPLVVELVKVEPTVEVYFSGADIGNETIQISGAAPTIDTTVTTHRSVPAEWTINIPVPGRTFGAVLGVTTGSQSDNEGTFIGSNDTNENVYVIDGAVVVEDHVVEDHVDDPVPASD